MTRLGLLPDDLRFLEEEERRLGSCDLVVGSCDFVVRLCDLVVCGASCELEVSISLLLVSSVGWRWLGLAACRKAM